MDEETLETPFVFQDQPRVVYGDERDRRDYMAPWYVYLGVLILSLIVSATGYHGLKYLEKDPNDFYYVLIAINGTVALFVLCCNYKICDCVTVCA